MFRVSLLGLESFEFEWFCVGSLGLATLCFESFGLGLFCLKSFSLKSFGLGLFSLASFNLASFSLPPFSLAPFGLPPFSLPPLGVKSFSFTSFSLASFSLASFSFTLFGLSPLDFKLFSLASFSFKSCSFTSLSLTSFSLKSFSLKSFSFKPFSFKPFSFKPCSFTSLSLTSFSLTSFSLTSFSLTSFSLKSFSLKSFSLKSFSFKPFSFKPFSLKSFSFKSFSLGLLGLSSLGLSSLGLESLRLSFSLGLLGSLGILPFHLSPILSLYIFRQLVPRLPCGVPWRLVFRSPRRPCQVLGLCLCLGDRPHLRHVQGRRLVQLHRSRHGRLPIRRPCRCGRVRRCLRWHGRMARLVGRAQPRKALRDAQRPIVEARCRCAIRGPTSACACIGAVRCQGGRRPRAARRIVAPRREGPLAWRRCGGRQAQVFPFKAAHHGEQACVALRGLHRQVQARRLVQEQRVVGRAHGRERRLGEHRLGRGGSACGGRRPRRCEWLA